jgi:aminopeptidase YwaD
MRRCLFIAVGLATLTTAAALAAEPGITEFPGLETIRAADLMKTVEYLASPRLAGRLAGSPGYMAAAREMAGRFRRMGLAPGAVNGFFQPLEIEYDEIGACRLALVLPDGATRELKLGPDFAARGLTGAGAFTAPVVFAGYGLSVPEKGYDDYAGLDARGRIVLAFKEPPPFRMDSLGWGASALPRPKGNTAAAHGALGLLLVSVPNQPRPQKPIGSMLEGEGPQNEHFPRLQVDGPVAQAMVETSGLDLGALQAAIDSTKQPRSRELRVSARIGVEARYHAKQPSVNVIGRLEGADPALRDQFVVVGAHLDHVGSQGGIYFPGANDNASGAAAVMAVARAFARGDARPKRSVLFVLFSSEESGLYGSKRFVEQPPVPLERIVACLNLDCVGHGDSIQVGSGKTSPRLWQLARDLDARGARLTVAETWGGGGADATPFAEKGIPTLYFASKFSYTYLHLPGDQPATLNPRLYEALVRLAYRTAWKVAEGDYAGE